MSRLLSTRLQAAAVAVLIAGLVLLAGCDRLGLGGGSQVAVESAATVDHQEAEPEPLPPVRAPVTSPAKAKDAPPVATPVVGGGFYVGSDDPDDTDPPLRAPGEKEPDFEPAIATDELDKPMDPPPEAEGLIRLPDPLEKGAMQDLWADKKNKRVVLGGRICRRMGEMELFACIRRTKEHESIVSVRARAIAVHSTLMALGIYPGRPVKFYPEFQAPDGPEIEVKVAWTDDKGKRQTVRAQEWLRDVRTKKAMEHDWIFAGSGFWKDDEGRSHYLADDGDLICVSNFASAMLDLPIHAPSANASLLFEGFYERIPPVGTPVAIILSAKPHEPLEAPEPKKAIDRAGSGR